MALDKATIINLDTREAIPVLFNPEEYTLDLGNTIAEIGIPGCRSRPFSTCAAMCARSGWSCSSTPTSRTRMSASTRRITALLEPSPTTLAPPVLLFSWSSLQFQCVLETVSQRFVMFKPSGMPVRARLTVVFKEFARLQVEIEEGLLHRAADGAQPRRGRDVEPAGA